MSVFYTYIVNVIAVDELNKKSEQLFQYNDRTIKPSLRWHIITDSLRLKVGQTQTSPLWANAALLFVL